MSKRVLVTGSSRGIGRAIALGLAQKGWTVALHYTQDEGAAQATASELGESVQGIYRADLAEPTTTAGLWAAALADGPVDALVNNAGVYLPISFLESEEDDLIANLHRTLAINFESPLRLCRLAARHFAEAGGGKILNVASRVGFRGEPNAATYAASKAALINLTRSLSIELAPKKVGVFGTRSYHLQDND